MRVVGFVDSAPEGIVAWTSSVAQVVSRLLRSLIRRSFVVREERRLLVFGKVLSVFVGVRRSLFRIELVVIVVVVGRSLLGARRSLFLSKVIVCFPGFVCSVAFFFVVVSVVVVGNVVMGIMIVGTLIIGIMVVVFVVAADVRILVVVRSLVRVERGEKRGILSSRRRIVGEGGELGGGDGVVGVRVKGVVGGVGSGFVVAIVFIGVDGGVGAPFDDKATFL